MMLGWRYKSAGGRPGRTPPVPRRTLGPAVRSGDRLRRGLTVPEMLISLIILAVLMVAIGTAAQGVLHSHAENHRISRLSQTARVVLGRILDDVRTADGVDADSQRITIVPPDNYEHVEEIEYEFDDGVLYYRRTIGGEQSSQALLPADGEVHVQTFVVTRQMAQDDLGVWYTKSLTVRLTLRSGNDSLSVTGSVCPRRNMDY